MKWLYRVMDKIFDPSPKQGTDECEDAGCVLDKQSEDSDYERHKHSIYRSYLLVICIQASLTFFLMQLVRLVF